MKGVRDVPCFSLMDVAKEDYNHGRSILLLAHNSPLDCADDKLKRVILADMHSFGGQLCKAKGNEMNYPI